MDIEELARHQGTDKAQRQSSTAGTRAPLEKSLELVPLKGVGATLSGRFVLEKCLGLGNTGSVYKAFDLRQREATVRNPHVAVKIFDFSLTGDVEVRPVLENAIQTQRALKHRNILAVDTLHLDGSLAYFTMEYVAATSLKQLLDAPGFSGIGVQQVLSIVSGVVKALAYAHRHARVHGDLKPANVLLTTASDIKVMDFGLAQVLRQAGQRHPLCVFDTTTLKGLTRAYLSADVLAGAVPDASDDLYSLACITYELLTGHHPYDWLLATQARDMRLEPHRPKQLTLQQWQALNRSLSLERETRTANVMQFFNAISTVRAVPRSRARTIGASAVALVGVASMATMVAVQHYRDSGNASGGSRVTATQGVASKAMASMTGKTPSTLTARMSTGSATDGASGTAGTNDTAIADNAGAPRNATPAAVVVTPAIKSLTQPLALAAVTPVLAGIACSALAATVTDNTIDVQGFISRSYGIARLNATLASIPGVENMKLDVQQIGEKDCPVVQLLAPFWLKSRNAGASLRTLSGNAHLTEGDPLVVDVKTPNRQSWVHADYYGLDGGVIHLLPSSRVPDNQAPPSYSTTIGGASNWIVSAPFGTEMVVLLTTPKPLFAGLRPEREATPDYLAALTTQLQQMASSNGGSGVAVEFLQIQTQPKK